jgi:hypothetical protein
MKDGTFIVSSAVIMCCGGFENDTELKRDIFGPRHIGLLGSPSNTGDGIRLAQKIGADLWHLNAEASVLGFLPPNQQCSFAVALRHPGCIIVNKHGKRFINEATLECHGGHSRGWRSGSMHLSSEIRRFDSFPRLGGVIGIMVYAIGREGDQSHLIYVDLYPFFVILVCFSSLPLFVIVILCFDYSLLFYLL